ncbi:MAG TPA: D-aminoacylase [Steroidobacteraceae bacterium]|nr:D-aminoacylase [Steroidobacteraceae bacterium]
MRVLLACAAVPFLAVATASAAQPDTASAAQPVLASAAPYDLIIRNGHVIDGTGSPWYAADVAIRGGHIAAIGRLQNVSARRTIDAHGSVVAPGFIDMLGQSELTILVDPRLPSKIYQGITSEITGEGESVAPLSAAMLHENQRTYAHYGIRVDWRTLAQYFARLRAQGMGINLGTYVGATSMREMVIGYGNRAATQAELARMQELVAQSMREGALGLSSALEYTPAPYASTAELIALARSAARYGGIYATHMRSEGDAEMASVDETVRIGREAHIPVEIFHLKAAGKANWGHVAQVIARIEAARAAGIDVAADTYAYTAWENTFSAFIPPWAHDGGNDALVARLQDPQTRARIEKDMTTPSESWDNEWLEITGPQDVLITAVQSAALRQYQGRRLDAIAREWHEKPLDALCDFLVKDHAGTQVAVFGMAQPDVDLVLRQPWVAVDNDAPGASPDGVLGRERPHPRAYGAFPRILRKYVHDEHLLTLPEAIRKFTALAAQRVGLRDRGLVKQGMWADLVVFDPEAVRDTATYEDPNRLAVGMQYVLVNGVPVIDRGVMTGALPGQVLYGPALSAAALNGAAPDSGSSNTHTAPP